MKWSNRGRHDFLWVANHTIHCRLPEFLSVEAYSRGLEHGKIQLSWALAWIESARVHGVEDSVGVEMPKFSYLLVPLC